MQNLSEWLPSQYQKAVESRKNEFLAGRYCAKKAAGLLGHTLLKLPVGSSREPVWPSELVGSISHTKSMACAVVASSNTTLSVGVDIEKLIVEKRIHVIEKMVIVETEEAYIKSLVSQSNTIKYLYTIVFSAKETLFKAIYPLNGEYFDFKEALVRKICLDERYIDLEIISERASLSDYLKTYRVQFGEVNGSIITLLVLDK